MCLTYRIICAFSRMLIYGACRGTSSLFVGKTTHSNTVSSAQCGLCAISFLSLSLHLMLKVKSSQNSFIQTGHTAHPKSDLTNVQPVLYDIKCLLSYFNVRNILFSIWLYQSLTLVWRNFWVFLQRCFSTLRFTGSLVWSNVDKELAVRQVDSSPWWYLPC